MENIRRFYKSNLIKVLTGVRKCGKSVLLNQIKDNNKYYIFLDEIKHIKQFEKVLASLKATLNVSIFVTRSNSKLLSGRLASLLACNDFNKVFVAHFIENLVYNELLYRGYDVKIGKTYKGEIDFVAMKDGKNALSN